MANSRDFREAFSCPTKEPTCELWWYSSIVRLYVHEFRSYIFYSACNRVEPSFWKALCKVIISLAKSHQITSRVLVFRILRGGRTGRGADLPTFPSGLQTIQGQHSFLIVKHIANQQSAAPSRLNTSACCWAACMNFYLAGRSLLWISEVSTYRRANTTCSTLSKIYNSFLEPEYYVRMDAQFHSPAYF